MNVTGNWGYLSGKRQADRPKRAIRLKPARILVFLVAGYLLFSAGSEQLRLMRLNAHRDEYAREIEQYRVQNDLLRQQIDMLSTDDYIEKMARERLGLVKQGEIQYLAGSDEGGVKR